MFFRCLRHSEAVSDAKVPNGTVSTIAKFQVDSGTPKLKQV
jgi:hypothetical protein